MKYELVTLCAVLGVGLAFSAFAGHCLAQVPQPSAVALDDGALNGEIASLRSAFATVPAMHVTEHFVILHDVGEDWACHTGEVLERTYTRFFQEFAAAGLIVRPPTGRLVWLGFARRDEFDRYAAAADLADLSHLDGYYSSRTNRIALCCGPAQPADGLPVRHAAEASLPQAQAELAVAGLLAGKSDGDKRLAHEAAHQLSFNSGLLKRGVMYPLWVSEGIATHFETDSGAAGGSAVAHGRRLAEAHAAGRTSAFSKFALLTRASTSDPATDYAQAWGTFRFLYAHRPNELKSYLRQLAELPLGPRDRWQIAHEFTQAFGPFAPIEQAWQQFLQAPSPVGPVAPAEQDSSIVQAATLSAGM